MFSFLGRPRGAAALCAASSIAIVAAIGSPAHAQEQQRQFNIPAQSLSSALIEFSRQSDVMVVADPAVVNGRRAPAVQGNFTPSEALHRLLAGSGLQATQRPGGGFVLADTSSPTQLGAAGRAASSENVTPDEEIVVTGTRIRGIAPVGSPVQTFTREEIEQTGAATIEQFARVMPQNLATVDASTAFFGATASGLNSGGNNQGFGAGFNLRGLGPSATLTLLNGHRVTPAGADGQFVDVSLIPLAAIERIEILGDGASAIYGADAIAGVVNLVLRDAYDGAETTVRYGAPSGGGEQATFSQLFGTTFERGNAMLVYEHYEQSELDASERTFVPDQGGPSYLLPRERRDSVFGILRLSLSPTTELNAEVFYASRETETRAVSFGGILGESAAEPLSYGSTVSLAQQLTNGWRLNATASYSAIEQPVSSVTPVFDNFNSGSFDLDAGEISLVLDGPIARIWGGDIRGAFGVATRSENLEAVGDTGSLSSGEVFFTTRDQLGRSVSSAFAELVVPLVASANEMPLVQRLQVSLAARYDDYDDVGASTNPKVGISWSPTDGLDFRASYGTSFRAPLLTQLVNTQGYIAIEIPDVTSPSGVTDTLVNLSSGNPSLAPEESAFSAMGFDFSPSSIPGFSLSATYFEIDFTGRIANPPIVGNSILNIFSQTDTLAPFIDTSPNLADVQALFDAGLVVDIPGLGPSGVGATFDFRPQNIARSRQEGLQIDASYAFSTPMGEIAFSAGGVHLRENSFRPVSNGPEASILGDVGAPPRLRLNTTLSWSRGGFSASANANYWDDYNNSLLSPSEPVDSWLVGNLSFGFDGEHSGGALQNTSILLAIQNVGDEPPPVVHYPAFFPNAGYDTANASATGRVVSLQIRQRW